MRIVNQQIPIPAGLNILRRKADVNPLIINYHIVSDQKLPYINHLYRYRDVSAFKKDIEFLISRYQPIGLIDLLENLKGGAALPQNAILITFDDGFKEVFEVVAPILLDYGITATFFITSDLVDNKKLLSDNKKSLLIERLYAQQNTLEIEKVTELIDHNNIPGDHLDERIRNIPYHRVILVDEIAALIGVDFDAYLEEYKPYLSTSQISNLLENGFTLGGHSIDHPRFRELSLEDQIHQAITSIDFIVKQFSLNYRVFAFPYSDHGVSKSFFTKISPHVDATFGTQGLLTDVIPTNLQRISLEKHEASAVKTIKFHYLRRIIYKYRNKDIILRN